MGIVLRVPTAVGRHRCTCSTAALQGTEPARCSCCSIYIDNCCILHCCCRCPQACRAVNGTSRSFIIHPVLVGNACPQSEWLIWRVFWSAKIHRLRQLSRIPTDSSSGLVSVPGILTICLSLVRRLQQSAILREICQKCFVIQFSITWDKRTVPVK